MHAAKCPHRWGDWVLAISCPFSTRQFNCNRRAIGIVLMYSISYRPPEIPLEDLGTWRRSASNRTPSVVRRTTLFSMRASFVSFSSLPMRLRSPISNRLPISASYQSRASEGPKATKSSPWTTIDMFFDSCQKHVGQATPRRNPSCTRVSA